MGTDVSQWQGTGIDWRAVNAAGWDFAFAKATEGSGFTDPSYARNEAAIDAVPGLIGGAYHFLRGGDGSAAASRFAAIAAPSGGRLCAVDVEAPELVPADVRRFAAGFADATGGHPLIVYIGMNVLISWGKRFPGQADLSGIGPWWLPNYVSGGYPGDGAAQWSYRAGGWDGPTIWQYGPARIPSYTGAVDGDACRLTAAQLAAHGGAMQPLYTTSGDPALVSVPAGTRLLNPDGTDLVKASAAFQRQSPLEVALGSVKYRLFTVTTGGHAVTCMARVADVKVSPLPPATPDASPFTQADVDAARTSGYATAKSAAERAVEGI